MCNNYNFTLFLRLKIPRTVTITERFTTQMRRTRYIFYVDLYLNDITCRYITWKGPWECVQLTFLLGGTGSVLK